MLSEKQLGTPWVAPVSWLSAPYKAVGLWPYSFLPSSCGWKLLPPALTKAPLTLSPSDFPSRGFEELGCAGGGKGGTGRINSFLPVEEYPQTPFLMKRAVSCSPGQMLAGHLFGKRFVVWRAERGLGGVGALWPRGSARSVHVPPRERAPCLPPGSCRGSAPTNAPTQGGVLLQLLFAGRNLF